MSCLGIRQPKRASVTGTTVMMDEEAVKNNGNPVALQSNNDNNTDSNKNEPQGQLKKNGTGIILHPQPEDDPNDPLNWPVLRKDLCFLIIGLQTFIGGGQTPILAAGFLQLQQEFGMRASVISYLVGAFMLALGVGSVFASPTAILYGKRLVYILAIFIFLIGSIVCAASSNYGGLMAGRILTGFGASPTESLASASLSELYFQHERAYRTGLYTLLLLGGKNILPLLSSLVFEYLDRHWLYWIQLMFLGLTLVLTFLFVPETYWDRSTSETSQLDMLKNLEKTQSGDTSTRQVSQCLQVNARGSQESSENRDTLEALETLETLNVLKTMKSLKSLKLQNPPQDSLSLSPSRNSDTAHNSNLANTPSSETPSLAPKSFKKRLHLVSGRHSQDKWWMVALRPIFLYAYPSVLYGSIVYSFAVVWLIVISEVLAEIFQGEHYRYSAQTVGLFYVSPFVGGILGSLVAGILGDKVTRKIVKKNHGIYEPEFRLFMLIPSTFFTCVGLMGYGWSAYEGDPWIAPVIFFGCLSFGSSMASTTAITYTIDCYKMFAAEALVSFNFAKNVIGFVFSLFNNHAFESLHGKKLFIVYGCVQLFVSLSGVLLYVYGKVFRSWTDEKELLRCLYHEDKLVMESESEAHERDSITKA